MTSVNREFNTYVEMYLEMDIFSGKNTLFLFKQVVFI